LAAEPPERGGALTRDSARLFESLAGDYEGHFAVPHRAAYDDLAWERLLTVLPRDSGIVVDAGCGAGRWAERLVAMGHHVVGIEEAPAMARAARKRRLGNRFELHEAAMEEVELDVQADVVLAMGSLQYSRDPGEMVARLAGWTRSGGTVLVLVDSLVALVVELLRAGGVDEALLRLHSRVGIWRQGDRCAKLHLLDRARLEAAFGAAGLRDVRSFGLLVGATVIGLDELISTLVKDRDGRLGLERQLAAEPLLADLGKHLLVQGRTP
jgi:SAM-dependent methyltransferase